MKIFGNPDAATLEQLTNVSAKAARVALMADAQKGYVMPVGGVAAYPQHVSVVGVGYDIACGNAAVMTELKAHQFTDDDLSHLADEIQDTISFGIGRSNKSDDAPHDHDLFKSDGWDAIPDLARNELRDKARSQLGTVGGGNHYVDVFADTQARIWVGVHFGSRGLGHSIAKGYMAWAQNQSWRNTVPEQETLLHMGGPMGQDYWKAMTLAGEYAHVGREWVARKVATLLGAAHELDLVHNNHNFAWRETHDGVDYYVVRKGATPAFPGQRGFVGGSMGDDSVILRGALTTEPEEIELQRSALYSTVHGAGRVMSRTAAKGKRRGQPNEIPPLIRHDDWLAWMTARGVKRRGGDIDEAPQAYRRLPDVLAAQGSTIEVLETLTPLIVVMAGANEYDPYKD